jgi:adenylate kinase
MLPQYAIAMEADDAHLAQKMKDLSPEKTANTHFDEAGMQRRLKEYRGKNVEDSGETVRDFFNQLIGYQNVLVVDGTTPAEEQIARMRELIEQKGKPCCINMISDEDRKFLSDLEKKAAKELRRKQRAELAAKQAEEAAEEGAEPAAEGEESKKPEVVVESEDEVDEVEQMIITRQAEADEAAAQEEEERKQALVDADVKKIEDEKQAAKLELLREQERDLLDTRSQPIRQYLMDNVVPHLTEGLIDLCKDIPDEPIDYLADFLLKKADEIDEKIIKEREAAAAAKLEAKKLKF